MIGRRALLGSAAVGALGLLAGCTGDPGPDDGSPGDQENCRTPGELVDFSSVGTGELLYVDSESQTTMQAEPGFLTQLDAWAEEWATLSGLGAITQVVSYGAFVDRCNSYHQLGQAFDVAEMRHESGTVSARYDLWQPGSAQQLRDYWRLAASLHLHFGYTLAYSYNEIHHNHLHCDNMVSRDGRSEFDPGSGTQLELIQHACRHVFGLDVEDTREWDSQTQDAVRAVQADAGLTQPLAETDGWHDFLRAAARG